MLLTDIGLYDFERDWRWLPAPESSLARPSRQVVVDLLVAITAFQWWSMVLSLDEDSYLRLRLGATAAVSGLLGNGYLFFDVLLDNTVDWRLHYIDVAPRAVEAFSRYFK